MLSWCAWRRPNLVVHCGKVRQRHSFQVMLTWRRSAQVVGTAIPLCERVRQEMLPESRFWTLLSGRPAALYCLGHPPLLGKVPQGKESLGRVVHVPIHWLGFNPHFGEVSTKVSIKQP
ncbi:unnamed protein product [Ostreobium quekettii]|uniref:Uncharacterized protein n=1 Tax=Ostreobium quekettii TaxID=121088 RepID=A0A8S1J446_9CHLO|nr:unnamed protein product [Ostreobium quekettii]